MKNGNSITFTMNLGEQIDRDLMRKRKSPEYRYLNKTKSFLDTNLKDNKNCLKGLRSSKDLLNIKLEKMNLGIQ